MVVLADAPNGLMVKMMASQGHEMYCSWFGGHGFESQSGWTSCAYDTSLWYLNQIYQSPYWLSVEIYQKPIWTAVLGLQLLTSHLELCNARVRLSKYGSDLHKWVGSCRGKGCLGAPCRGYGCISVQIFYNCTMLSTSHPSSLKWGTNALPMEEQAIWLLVPVRIHLRWVKEQNE